MKVGVGSVLLLLVAACADAGVRPQGSLQSADSADQIMVGMSTQLTEKGVLQSIAEITAGHAHPDVRDTQRSPHRSAVLI